MRRLLDESVKNWRYMASLSGRGCGVYIIWAGVEALYVGTSNCLGARIACHPRRNELISNGANRMTFIHTPDETGSSAKARKARHGMEMRMIGELKPRMNVMGLMHLGVGL